MDTLYNDLMNLCSQDEIFYFKDTRLHGIDYRIFNHRLCSYGRFQTHPAARNCCGVMFNITNTKCAQLVSLPLEKIFDYEEGFGQKQFHERGRLGVKMDKMDGSLMTTFLHGRESKDQILRLKSKQSLTSNQVQEAMRLLKGEFKTELERLVCLNYTVNMEYTTPSNHVFVAYAEPQLTVLSIRCHENGETLFGNRLRDFLLERHFLTIVNRLVPFQTIPSNVTQKQLLEDTYQETLCEGYVVEIIHPGRSSYLVKIKTQKYFMIYGDRGTENSPRALFEALIYGDKEHLIDLFKDDITTLERIADMEQHIRPKYHHIIQLVEEFYLLNKHSSKKDFVRSVTNSEHMKIYLPLLVRLYSGDDNDYKGFAMKHAKDLFGVGGKMYQDMITMHQDKNGEYKSK
ncbi:unnamed protein product [Adineta ricciae]|uniref:T4 RNA ligase 1-like N-terminal domain-containing protein n=2 Tax=Adineta ricciae TaxID=249248 RepID=A0A814QP73_ADIRI|nr:unnamed protein product [Adineta ricciae]